MLLHEIPEGSKLKIDVASKENSPIDAEVTFHHLDGMYSYCTIDDNGWIGDRTLHLSANTPLKLVGEHYEIDREDLPTKE